MGCSSRIAVLLSLFMISAPFSAGANGFLQKGQSCTGDCDPQKAPFVYTGWTDFETLCDAVPIGMIEVTGRADPLQFDFDGTQKKFSAVFEGLAQAENLSCGTGDARALARAALGEFKKLEEKISPGLRAYDCAASGVSRMERLELVKNSMDEIRKSEEVLKNFLRRAKPIGIAAESEMLSGECAMSFYNVWYNKVIVNAHGLSCRLHYAERTVNFTMSSGMNPMLAKTCENVRETDPSPSPAVEPSGPAMNESDITGI